jgi:hypothetical protein
VTALFPARGKHFPAVLRAHALEKTMDPLAAAIVGLKSAFHGSTSSKLCATAPVRPAEQLRRRV